MKKLAYPSKIMSSIIEEAVDTHESVVQRHHLYKVVWSPALGETHCRELEEGNKHDVLLYA